jgi:hypothetical protein
LSSQVDIYHAATGQWSIASLSLARSYISATTVGNLALFAGGQTSLNGTIAIAPDHPSANTNLFISSLYVREGLMSPFGQIH